MTNSNLKFNESNFSALLAWHIDSNNKQSSLESVLNVLRQSSDGSRLGKLNHNCRVSGIPFTWDYYTGYGEDRNQIKVLTFPMCKISTGWDFYLDVEESGALYISEGIGTRRTSCKSSILNAFAPSTMTAIADTIDLLCGREMSKKQIFFDIYRRFGGNGDLRYSKIDMKTKSMYNMYAFNSDYKYLEYMQKYESDKNYVDEIIHSNCGNRLVIVQWSESHNCWYTDFIVDDSAWHIDALMDVKHYPIKEDLTFNGDESTKGYIQRTLIYAVKSVMNKSNAKSGSWFCYGICDLDTNFSRWESTRLWSEIPEIKKRHIFVSTDKDCRYFYDDFTEINLTPDFQYSRVDFTWSHESCESPDNGCIENEDESEDEESIELTQKEIEDARPILEAMKDEDDDDDDYDDDDDDGRFQIVM